MTSTSCGSATDVSIDVTQQFWEIVLHDPCLLAIEFADVTSGAGSSRPQAKTASTGANPAEDARQTAPLPADAGIRATRVFARSCKRALERSPPRGR